MGCSRLQHIELLGMRSITDMGVCSLIAANPDLRELALTDCRNQISDVALTALGACPLLTQIDVSRCSVSDNGIAVIATSCPNLAKLSMRLTDVTNAGLAVAARGLRHLEYLDVCWCDISDEALFELAEHCPKLKVLQAMCNGRITDEGVTKLVQGCPLLTSLNLSETGISREAVRAIATCCENLKRLEICTENEELAVPPEVYYALLAARPKIKVLGLMGNKLITKAVVKRISREHPSVELIVSARLLPTTKQQSHA